MSIPLGERFAPGPIVNRLPVPRRNTNRPDRGEQVVGDGQALRRRKGSGPRRITSPHPVAADRLEQVPPPLIRKGASKFSDLSGVIDVRHAAEYTHGGAIREHIASLTPSPNHAGGPVRESSCPRIIDPELASFEVRRSRMARPEHPGRPLVASALNGPRQFGKTTLAREFLSIDSLNYFDLEDPSSLTRLDEPDTALRPLKGLVVVDEIQRRPDLFPLLRVLADRRPLPARFLILGSAAPELLRQSSETLAGRIETVALEGFRLADLIR